MLLLGSQSVHCGCMLGQHIKLDGRACCSGLLYDAMARLRDGRCTVHHAQAQLSNWTAVSKNALGSSDGM